MQKIIRLHASPTWPGVENDYVLRYDGHSIGRIRLDEDAWEWQVTIPMAMPAWARGTAASLEECKSAFGVAWGRLLKETSSARLERAWELERAAAARQQRMDKANENNTQAQLGSGDQE